MRIAVYVRVSTQRQAQAQTIEQQLDRLHAHCQRQDWPWQEEDIFRDDGYSGSLLKRPGLDRLRNQAAQAAFDCVLITAPDRLARKFVHQVLLIEELERSGCLVEFLEHPMSQDPHDQLLLQIRGAVAEYERSLRSRADAAWTTPEASGGHVVTLDETPPMAIGQTLIDRVIPREYVWKKQKPQ
jgi:site-specific DNA recombinase